jgi:hypothetical protein
MFKPNFKSKNLRHVLATYATNHCTGDKAYWQWNTYIHNLYRTLFQFFSIFFQFLLKEDYFSSIATYVLILVFLTLGYFSKLYTLTMHFGLRRAFQSIKAKKRWKWLEFFKLVCTQLRCLLLKAAKVNRLIQAFRTNLLSWNLRKHSFSSFNKHFFKATTLYIAGFDFTTHSSSLL